MGTLTTQISFFVVPEQALGAGCTRAESRTTSGKGKVMMIQHSHGVDKNYFAELREQITNRQKWDAEHFIVFDHEAGSGKTRQALRIIGEMTRDSDHRVLWVQLFSDERKRLDATADTINEYAGKFVAVAVDGEDTRTTPKKQRLIGVQVLVITHRMYAQICKGEHKELIQVFSASKKCRETLRICA
ncbi:hypothetical protein [Alicyclobacillus shizuokensis]|uniref:hypothetical protein n=1 Tax=Alicyclobacillus shizuokensis TaxID=392014 RepID=UPI00082D9DF3|nr:hypothetical protein [Alicyclobacillus shizuokensis]